MTFEQLLQVADTSASIAILSALVYSGVQELRDTIDYQRGLIDRFVDEFCHDDGADENNQDQ